ncbi:MAG: DNA polymerase I [Chloroflexota bacterium]
MSDTLVLIDGHALVFRAFHALPPFTSPAGEMVNAVYGFTSMLFKACRELKPRYVIATFDVSSQTFRKEAFEAYKATRGPQPEGLRPQFDVVLDLVAAMNIPIFRMQGFEADDLLGTLSKQAAESGVETVIVTGDTDALQLVGPHVRVLTSRRGFTDTVVYDENAVHERYGLTPSQLADYRALRGDSSDNIPGVPGIGDKTAAKLLQTFGTVEALFERLEEVPAKQRTVLEEHRDQVMLSKKLATIVRDVPITLDLPAAELGEYDRQQIVGRFRELGFRSLVDEIDRSLGGTSPSANGSDQLGLFDEPASAPATDAGIDGADELVIRDTARLDHALAEIRASGVVGLAPQLSTSAPTRADIVGLGLAATADRAWYVPIGHLGETQLPWETVRTALESLFADPAVTVQAHNAKVAEIVLKRNGLSLSRVGMDTMIAAYLIESSQRSQSLRDLAWSRLQIEMPAISSVTGTGRSATTLDRVAAEALAPLATQEARALLQLIPLMQADLDKAELGKLMTEIELPLSSVLAAMEQVGIAIDVPYLNAFSRELATRVDELETSIYGAVGHEFKINSPAQLGQILYDELKLPRSRKTRTGQASTGADVLEELRGAHPVVELVLEHRQLTKLKSTYVDALPALVNPDTGRVHTSFNQTVAATGRLSSSDPNLQNIPVRTELGRRVRKAFIAGRPDQCLLSADYSQFELRILAHITEDPTLVEAFRADRDIHAATAAEVMGVDIGEVNPDMRRFAKVVNFGVLYGMSEYGLSQQSGLPPERAADFIRRYFERFPSIRGFQDELVARTIKDGYATTILGRRRYIPELQSSVYAIRQAGQRMAVNHPIQGSQADVVKIAMIQVQRALHEESLPATMLLQVHDELVFEVDRSATSRVAERVRQIMEHAMELAVPVKVELKAGDNWEEMHALELVTSA